MNLNITKVTDWMGLSAPRMALYQGSEMELSIFMGDWGDDGPPGGYPWLNMLAWIDLYYQGRCRRIVDLPAKESEGEESKPKPKPTHQVEVAIKIFDEVDELLEKDDNMTLAKLLEAVGKHQRAMSRFLA
jgi:hypothetical protein